MKPFKRPIAVIDCSSSSAPFMNKLAAPNRVVITATRSGAEENYARFGEYFAQAIADPKADLDKDGQTSLLEAYLTASRQVAEFYTTAGRLATEHALLDDNGDGQGTPADWFQEFTPSSAARDGSPARCLAREPVCVGAQRRREKAVAGSLREARRTRGEADAKLRDRKGKLSEDDYYSQLGLLVLDLARLQNPAGR